MSKSICKTSRAGTKIWQLNDQWHRDDGPAIIRIGGDKEWWFNDELHRTDGPAIEWADGAREWWFNDLEYLFEDYVVKAGWTDEQIVMYKLEHF